MRRPLLACAGTAPLMPGAGAAAATPACAGTTEALLGTSLSYTLVNGVRVLLDARFGQPFEAPLSTSNEDGGTFAVPGTVPPGTRVPCPVRSHAHHPRGDAPPQQGTFEVTQVGTSRPGQVGRAPGPAAAQK